MTHNHELIDGDDAKNAHGYDGAGESQCPKCGWHWMAHNGDGSCVIDNPADDIGIHVTALFRATINNAGIPWKEAEQLGEIFDSALKTADWIELDDGTTFYSRDHAAQMMEDLSQ